MASRDMARLLSDARGHEEEAIRVLDEASAGTDDELIVGELRSVIQQQRSLLQRIDSIRTRVYHVVSSRRESAEEATQAERDALTDTGHRTAAGPAVED